MKRVGRLLALALLAAPAALAATPDWLRQAAQAPAPAVNTDARAVVLFEEQVTSVRDNGEIFTVYRRALKVLRPQGRDEAIFAVPFDSETRITWLKAWTISPQGRETEFKEKETIETSLLSGMLYEDTRHKILRAPVDVGGIFGYEFEQKRRPMIYQDSWRFQGELPVARTRFELRLPAGWEHEVFWANHAAVEPQSAGPGFTWQLENVPALEYEPQMPARRAVAGRMVLNYFPPKPGLKERAHNSWQQVGRWYQGLTAGRMDSSAEIKARVLELTRAAAGPLDKMRALAAYVQRNIRYVAVEIGVGGYQPRPAGEILKNQYGDCKDKVTLLGAMLREIGVESRYVLVHTDRGVVRPEIPSALGFNHVVLAIQLPAGVDYAGLHAPVQHPSLGTLLYFDPTDEHTAFGDLPSSLQAGYGLVVAPQGGELVQLPQLDPASNRLSRRGALEVAPDGTLRGEIEEVRTGDLSHAVRARLLASQEADRAKVLETLLAPFLSHFRLVSATVGNLEQYGEPLTLRYKFEAPHYAQVAGNLLLLRPRVLGEKSDDVLERKQRHYSIEFDHVSDQADSFEIKLPPGYAVDELPGATRARYDFAEYTSETRATADAIRYTREFRVKALRVDEPRFQELKKFYRQIAADEQSSAVLKRQD